MSEFARALPRAAVQIMKINGSTALVTGANRGLGRAFVQALRDAGCTKIYAAARARGRRLRCCCRPGATRHQQDRTGLICRHAVPRRRYPDQQCWRCALRSGARGADDG